MPQAEANKPLDGMRVFDLTWALAGPWSTMLMAALGAEVFKVESHDGDRARGVPPRQNGMTALYMHSNFGKKCVKFNLKREFDFEVALKLAGTCDVFVENFRPGKADSLGLGYEAVRKINPRIVYCSLSVYGSHGPRSLEAGADPHIQAASGFCSVTGQPGGRWEMYRQYAHLDITAAATVVQAVLVGLFAREMTGEGQRIETSMLGSAITLQATRLAEYFATGKSPVPMGSASAVAAPHEAFLCNDGQYLAVSAETDSEWHSLCAALGLHEMNHDGRFLTNADRIENRDALSSLLAEVFRRKPVAWWVMLLGRFDVAAGPVIVNQFDLIRYHEQNRVNGHITQVETPWGDVFAGGVPWSFGDEHWGYRAPPRPGEHTREVFETMGFTFDESSLGAETDWSLEGLPR